jgi:hypothetical protein
MFPNSPARHVLAVVFLLLLSACARSTSLPPTASAREPSAGLLTMPPTWTPAPTETRRPWQTSVPPTAVEESPTALVLNNPFLTGIEKLLPEGGQALRDKAWQVAGQGTWWGFWYVPFQRAGGVDVALIGLPRSENGSWDRKTLILLWTWGSEHPDAPLWQSARALPYSLGQVQNAFLVQAAETLPAADGSWRVVVLNGKGTPASGGSALQTGAVLPVSSPDDLFLAISPVEQGGADYYFLRDGQQITVTSPTGETVWQATNVPGKRLTVSTGAPPVQVDGGGPIPLILSWTGEAGTALQLFAVEAGKLRLIAEPSVTAQFLEIDGDGLREFIDPRPESTPPAWDVTHWTGSAYESASTLEVPAAKTPVVVKSWTALPALPVDLYLLGPGGWGIWPRAGGSLAAVTGTPPAPALPCTAELACASPDRRYSLALINETQDPTPTPKRSPTSTVTPVAIATGIFLPSATPGLPTPTTTPVPHTSVGIRGGGLVRIPGTGSPEGQNQFAWLPDGGLILARAGSSGGLFRVDPATGVSLPLLEIALCGLTGLPCPQYSTGMGATDPFLFPNGDLGFAVQGTLSGQYPPQGIYRRGADGTLTKLADLPQLDPFCVVNRSGYAFGRVIWAPDGSAFLYYSPSSCPDGVVLLGLGDGSAVWNLSLLSGTITDLRFSGDK